MKTALITGGAQRIGAQITQTLHAQGYWVIIHYRNSRAEAKKLAEKLNQIRPDSARIQQADLTNIDDLKALCASISTLHILINNASIFLPTPSDGINALDYQITMDSNLRAPLLLCAELQKKLAHQQGCIINIVDIHSLRPLKNYPIYNLSKAGLAMLTQTLAKEFAPDIRVCGVSPGSILWPEDKAELSLKDKEKMLKKIALKRQGSPQDIADAVLFLTSAKYITGQIINVDGGRTLNQ
jgi:pteridine reductase